MHTQPVFDVYTRGTHPYQAHLYDTNMADRLSFAHIIFEAIEQCSTRSRRSYSSMRLTPFSHARHAR
ncbi:protein of unknown function [Pararobbsia alpina]